MITFQFVTAGTLADRAIQLYSHGWPSHVDIVLPDGSLLGAQASPCGGKAAGVEIRPPGYETWARAARVALAASPEQEAKFLAFARAQIGKPYDMPDLLGDFLIGRDWRNPGAWWCSELGAAALEASGWLPHRLPEDVNHVTPWDLYMVVAPWNMGAPLRDGSVQVAPMAA